MYIIRINEEGGHEFEREQGGIYQRVYLMEEMEEGNDVIMISKIKEKYKITIKMIKNRVSATYCLSFLKNKL